ncbi:PD-(D/E)XK nuclease family protein [Pseudomonas sp. GD03721]|nr:MULTISPECIES: PD-(D/E)XK nuclease family protein [unclassified Pseudomonas]MDH1443217.1 PD-(D/E)XK nuclease family protein [Pseudomonas sp. GD03722]WGG00731.1 PD-(D/E)XK nuclease family protein [Pseudomonas sp. GD03721]WGG04897.1 PD-(D/E)XK nuclease family protein [Pseudomonas sp. GD03919]
MSTPATIIDLLDAVRIRAASLAEAKQRYAAELAPDFNLVDHLRNNEVALSRYLGLLLDTKGVHGQGELFLSGLLQRLGQPGFEPQDLLRVELEQRTHSGRFLDIYLEFRGGVIGIENKPWAADQDKQLEDYARFLQMSARGGHWLLVYACNWEPSEASLNPAQREALEQTGNFLRLDFLQIAEWLDESACHARAPKVRLFVEALSAYVRKQVNGEIDVSEAEQIKTVILQKPEHLEAALKVAQSIDQVKAQLLAEFKESLGHALKAEGLILVWEDKELATGKLYAGFGVKLNAEHRLHLRFEFWGDWLNSLIWGIRRDSDDLELNTANVVAIAQAMDRAFGTGSSSLPWWPWYAGTGGVDHVLVDAERNWSISAEPWLRINDKSERGFVSRIVKLALEVSVALAGVDDAMR